jgi:hypothetical protein
VSTAAELPDRRLLWRWVWSAVRPLVGWLLALLGAVALFLGWWGVSGEALTAKQIPYLVSGGLTGIALVIMAAVVLATDDVRRELGRMTELERKIDELYALFVADMAGTDMAGADGAATAASTPVTSASAVVALPAGASYHRPDCALVVGKSDVSTVDRKLVGTRSLRPCRVCDPAPVS